MNPSNGDYLTVAFSELKQRVIRLEAWQREHDEAIEARLRGRDKKKLIAKGLRKAAGIAVDARCPSCAQRILDMADELDPP